MDVTEILVGLGAAVIATIVAILAIRRTEGQPDNTVGPNGQGSVSFLFSGDELVDLSDAASEIMDDLSKSLDWASVMALFQPRFDLPASAHAPPEQDGQTIYRAINKSDSGVMEISRFGQNVRIEVFNAGGISPIEAERLSKMSSELAILKEAVEATPVPIWKQTAEGDVTWYNPAYRNLALTATGQDPEDANPLFSFGDTTLSPGKIRRLKLNTSPPDPSKGWYDVHRTSSGYGAFYSALEADAIVRAEVAQRNFVQTLAKTFAHLPIGLAIFDGNRQLMLFNPALIDLTGLGAEFLSSRPNLASFFDELRDRNMMPEPKNYSSWRQQIADLVAAASDGRYSETWTLPNNRTYRINGRPHPDGAVAFLIEDISAEVSLTRSFRAELELGQSVVDGIDSAIAVFTATGVLTMTNEAYRQLWMVDPDSSFAEFTFLECLKDWRLRCHASPVLGELRNFVLDQNERAAFSASIQLLTGESLEVAAIPLVSGSSMIRFATGPGKPAMQVLDTSLKVPVET